jgi:multidrug/hemolysin transport system permease protein
VRQFLSRNLQIYFKDKATVFYSLIGTLMIFALYVLFLGSLWSTLYHDVKNVSHLVDSWVMAGILSVVSITSTAGALGIMVNDKSTKISKDFYSSPVKKSHIAGGYVLCATIVGLIMSFIMLALAEVYIFSRGGELLGLSSLIKVIGLIVIVSLSNTSVMLFFASFFRSHNAYTSAAGIIGSMIGFIAGAYIPIGMFPRWIQTILEPLPLFQASALLREQMMGSLLQTSFSTMPQNEINEFHYMFGISTRIGNYTISSIISFIILIVTFIIFFSLSAWNLAKKEQ